MNSLILRAVVAELAARRGLRVEGVSARDTWEIHLRLEGEASIVVCVHPAHNALYLAETAPPPGTAALPFAALLDQNASGARLAGVVQCGLDRVAALAFERRDRLGDTRRIHLVAELTGRGANLVLVEGDSPWDGTVIDQRREVRSARREALRPGRPYVRPPSSKPDASTAPTADLAAALRAASAVNPLGPGTLVAAWEGVNREAAAEVWLRAGTESDPLRLAQAWGAFLAEVQPAGDGRAAGLRYRPTEVQGPGAEPLCFRPTATPAAGTVFLDHPRASSSVAAWHEGARAGTSAVSLHPDLERSLRQAILRTERGLDALQAEETASDRAGEERRLGEAILAAAHGLRRGMERAEILEPRTGETMVVDLNPKLSPAENAELRFKRARKGERTRAHVESRRRALRSRGEALQALALDLGSSGPTPAWSSRAVALGVVLPALAAPRGQEEGPEDRLPTALRPRRYELGGGWAALVGKSNRGNDVLTHEIARPHDLWLHADQVSGSHVVLRHAEKGKEPPPDVLLAAAALAAWFSDARNAGKVPVIVAEKRQVRRARKGAPGLAHVGRHRTVMVKPSAPERG